MTFASENTEFPATRDRVFAALRFSLLGAAAALVTAVFFSLGSLSGILFLPLVPGMIFSLFLVTALNLCGLTDNGRPAVFVVAASLLGWSVLVGAGSLGVINALSGDGANNLLDPVTIIAIGLAWCLSLTVTACLLLPVLRRPEFFLPNAVITGLTSYPGYLMSARLVQAADGWMADFAAHAVLFLVVFVPYAAITGFALPNPPTPESPAGST